MKTIQIQIMPWDEGSVERAKAETMTIFVMGVIAGAVLMAIGTWVGVVVAA